MNAEISDCPCGSGEHFKRCCQPFLVGDDFPKTPEALMRSRYSAFATQQFDYLNQTEAGPAAMHSLTEDEQGQRSKMQWLGLTVLESSAVNNADTGFVKFIAFFEIDGKKDAVFEKSEFKKIDGRWYYYNGTSLKWGRNDPCFCGSGKKYKKCCV